MLRCSGRVIRTVARSVPALINVGQTRQITKQALESELNKLLGIDSTKPTGPPKAKWLQANDQGRSSSSPSSSSSSRNQQRRQPRREEERSEVHKSRPRKEGFGLRRPEDRASGERSERPSRIFNPAQKPKASQAEVAKGSSVSEAPEAPDLAMEVEDGEPGRSWTKEAHVPRGKEKKGKGRGSLTKPPSAEPAYPSQNPHKNRYPAGPPGNRDRDTASSNLVPNKKKEIKKKVEKKIEIERDVYIPSISVKVGDLARMVDVRLVNLQQKMRDIGMTDEQCHSDNYLMSEEAVEVVLNYGFNPIVDEERSFDIFPEPTESDTSTLPLRPPVVTIMGHVDHGKTTLLDSLRHTSVAAGEAGGITQHIGAFSVPLASLVAAEGLTESGVQSITFLDTPGHAAFTGMRARGASVTDIVVLVVAADDGVMPQTKEVLELVKQSGVGLVVAINKCDKPGLDFHRVKSALGAEGIHLEEDGGDVPSIRVSGLKREGLDTLVETLGVLAEVRDLRSSVAGRAEAWVLESRIEKGRGNMATILVTRGTLKVGSVIVAGTTWCKVRQMTDDKNKLVKEASPGMPVTVTGWKELPQAGDQILQPPTPGHKAEDEAKRAVANRIRDVERKALMKDVEIINEKRRLERERQVEEEAKHEAIKAEGGDVNAAIRMEERKLKREDEDRGKKELRLIIRADVSGTVEAVVGSLEGIGNSEVCTKIIHTGVGDVTDSDVAMAVASDATIIGFSVKAARSVESLAASQSVPLQLESVIYRLIETVRSKVAALLPPIVETRVIGEATVLQVFTIAVKGQKEGQIVAGCRIGNGLVSRNDTVRILRGDKREQIFEGPLESLKHLKKEITEARKGSECGMAVVGFRDIQEGDQIVAIQKIERAQEL